MANPRTRNVRDPFRGTRAFWLISLLLGNPVAAQAEHGKVIVESSTESLHIAQALVSDFNERHQTMEAVLVADIDARGIGNRPLGKDRLYLGLDGIAHSENITAIQIYLEAIAFVVHEDNPVSNITREHIKSLLKKRDAPTAMRWDDLSDRHSGGIVIHGPLAISEVGRFMMKDVVKDLIGGYQEHERFTAIAQAVSQDPFAIGFIPIGYASREKLKMLSIEGVSPHDILKDDRITPASGYPLTRGVSLHIGTAATPMTTARHFMEYVLSADGLAVLKQSGMIPWHPSFGPEAK